MASMNEKDYYAVLGVDQSADTNEIRKAFQQKARKLHPDVNKEPDAEERFKEVSEAYAVLSDSDKRARYDAMRSGNPFAAGYGSTAAGSNGGYSGQSPFGSGFPFGGTWSTRSSRARSYRPRAGADLTYELELDAETANAGVRRGVTYQRYATCDVCHGSGSVEHAHATTCPTCGGAGRMRVDMGGLGLFGLGFLEVTCPECEGSGQVIADPCTACGGSGRVMEAAEVVVDVPEHSHDGDEVRVPAMGNAGTNGRESGDFVCQIRVDEERLSAVQEAGFKFVGFAVPFIALGLISKLVSMTIIGAALATAGIVMAVREGLRFNSYWWRSGFGAAAGAVLYGALFAVAFLSPITRFFSSMLLVMAVVSLFSTRRMQ